MTRRMFHQVKPLHLQILLLNNMALNSHRNIGHSLSLQVGGHALYQGPSSSIFHKMHSSISLSPISYHCSTQ
eukprot:c46101_g1_i1 orf=158-373(+)